MVLFNININYCYHKYKNKVIPRYIPMISLENA